MSCFIYINIFKMTHTQKKTKNLSKKKNNTTKKKYRNRSQNSMSLHFIKPPEDRKLLEPSKKSRLIQTFPTLVNKPVSFY